MYGACAHAGKMSYYNYKSVVAIGGLQNGQFYRHTIN